jgi:nucleoside-diphosphate-sugar epimerase
MHTILGANGVIARGLSRELGEAGTQLRQVSRHPQRVNANDETRSADLLDPKATADAVAGSEVAYLVAGLQYSTAVWREQWPKLMRNVIDACKQHRTRLVFFDNVYAYGRVDGKMTEETPFNPCSKKGEVRAQIATTLLEEMDAGNVEAMIVRAADFYGPGAHLSLTYSTVFEKLRAGKTPQWIGNPKKVHTFSYTPDASRAVAELAQSPGAYGQTWHVPTSKEELTGEGFVRQACSQAARPFKMQTVPRWLLKLMGLFIAVLRENDEMMYQFEYDYRFDSTKIEKNFGLQATAYDYGIKRCLQDGS